MNLAFRRMAAYVLLESTNTEQLDRAMFSTLTTKPGVNPGLKCDIVQLASELFLLL